MNANETTFGPPVVITAYQSVTSNGSPIATPPPKTTRNQRLLKKGQDAIIAECVRVLVKLPKFVPGRLDGESVTTRFVKYFVFNIE